MDMNFMNKEKRKLKDPQDTSKISNKIQRNKICLLIQDQEDILNWKVIDNSLKFKNIVKQKSKKVKASQEIQTKRFLSIKKL